MGLRSNLSQNVIHQENMNNNVMGFLLNVVETTLNISSWIVLEDENSTKHIYLHMYLQQNPVHFYFYGILQC